MAPGSNSLVAGGVLAVAQVSTLGQPFEVLKTHLAANRHDTLRQAISKTWARGGIQGFYQGLLPWGAIEASTKGAILLFSAHIAEDFVLRYFPGQTTLANTAGGMIGGMTQAYAVMGLTTTMKTIEITRSKASGSTNRGPSTLEICKEIYARDGLKGLNKGLNAVALRQMTTWASRMGITRFIEGSIRRISGKSNDSRLGPIQKILASSGGGALSCWNQPFEVLRIEMQSAKPSALRASRNRPTMLQTARYIYQTDGVLAFYRGVMPRMMLAASVTTFMVAGGDWIVGMLPKA
ncbi:mitochondrial carrier domain-containing protein [Kockovaella imperatae]|uniref:Mitochondrial carrier domain-containing protein n=1 Tax=Kockovaella imperatae TaxID=4999 RepID=A0A1Y1UFY1_9TREE|nr:mitochondrial carrier domain-containing protein [Kockovaella imperatae]ORX36922.1 mitochondrial carrier domain-containing protein [Kockovaella imperatae]